MKESYHSVGKYKAYLIGFILCIVLTLASYFMVTERLFSVQTIFFTIIGLAIVQTFVQLVCFLSLGKEPKPHWNSIVFLFAAIVLIILVFGSMWIMYHLEYRLMSMPAEGM